eukprot:4549283-Ditylum_brightwellii.AAC.1
MECAKKKKRRGPRPTVLKYGIDVPCNVVHAGDIPEGNYQLTMLHMIFDIKQDLHQKTHLVAGGHLMDVLDNEVYSSTVKGISVKLLHVITCSEKLDVLCSDIGNAYVNVYTTEKVYVKAGLEFGEENIGKIVVIWRALYGLATSSARFHDHLVDTLCSMDFQSTRFDRDVRIHYSEDGESYKYMCTHVDDFCIFSKSAQMVMKQVQSVYTVNSVGASDYYLEAVSSIKWMFGKLLKHEIPMVSGDHPEEEDSTILDDSDHQKYQMLLGMFNLVVVLGRLDITYVQG